MTDGEYKTLADAFFARLQDALDDVEDGLDYEEVGGGVLEIEFEDGSKIVVNRQAAAHEIWVAARSGGFHYRWDGAAWRDTRGGEELFTALSRLASEQAGMAVRLV
jgi:CyaY protein